MAQGPGGDPEVAQGTGIPLGTCRDAGKGTFPWIPVTPACPPAVCSIRVIGESDIMQEFLSESDEVGGVIPRNSMGKPFHGIAKVGRPLLPASPQGHPRSVSPSATSVDFLGQFHPFWMDSIRPKLPEFLQTPQSFGMQQAGNEQLRGGSLGIPEAKSILILKSPILGQFQGWNSTPAQAAKERWNSAEEFSQISHPDLPRHNLEKDPTPPLFPLRDFGGIPNPWDKNKRRFLDFLGNFSLFPRITTASPTWSCAWRSRTSAR